MATAFQTKTKETRRRPFKVHSGRIKGRNRSRSQCGPRVKGSDTQGGRSQAAAGAGRAPPRERRDARAGTKGHVGKWQPSIEEVVLRKCCTMKVFGVFFSKSPVIV